MRQVSYRIRYVSLITAALFFCQNIALAGPGGIRGPSKPADTLQVETLFTRGGSGNVPERELLEAYLEADKSARVPDIASSLAACEIWKRQVNAPVNYGWSKTPAQGPACSYVTVHYPDEKLYVIYYDPADSSYRPDPYVKPSRLNDRLSKQTLSENVRDNPKVRAWLDVLYYRLGALDNCDSPEKAYAALELSRLVDSDACIRQMLLTDIPSANKVNAHYMISALKGSQHLEVIHFLAGLLAGDNAHAARDALAKSGPCAKSAIFTEMQRLPDGRQYIAASALSGISSREEARPLLDMLSGIKRTGGLYLSEATGIIEALARGRGPSMSQPYIEKDLIKIFQDCSDDLVKKAIVKALKKLDRAVCEDFILSLLDDKSSLVQIEAIRALREWRASRAINKLKALLNADDHLIRTLAAEAITEIMNLDFLIAETDERGKFCLIPRDKSIGAVKDLIPQDPEGISGLDVAGAPGIFGATLEETLKQTYPECAIAMEGVDETTKKRLAAILGFNMNSYNFEGHVLGFSFPSKSFITMNNPELTQQTQNTFEKIKKLLRPNGSLIIALYQDHDKYLSMLIAELHKSGFSVKAAPWPYDYPKSPFYESLPFLITAKPGMPGQGIEEVTLDELIPRLNLVNLGGRRRADRKTLDTAAAVLQEIKRREGLYAPLIADWTFIAGSPPPEGLFNTCDFLQVTPPDIGGDGMLSRKARELGVSLPKKPVISGLSPALDINNSRLAQIWVRLYLIKHIPERTKKAILAYIRDQKQSGNTAIRVADITSALS
ncbi:MAG: HEAT repeat domain-containing protein, partial [Candidatus Omnitrophota bacterium]